MEFGKDRVCVWNLLWFWFEFFNKDVFVYGLDLDVVEFRDGVIGIWFWGF